MAPFPHTATLAAAPVWSTGGMIAVFVSEIGDGRGLDFEAVPDWDPLPVADGGGGGTEGVSESDGTPGLLGAGTLLLLAGRADEATETDEALATETDETDTLSDGDETDTARDGDETDTARDGDETDTLTDGDETDTLTDGDETDTLTDGDETDTLSDGDETDTLSDGDETDFDWTLEKEIANKAKTKRICLSILKSFWKRGVNKNKKKRRWFLQKAWQDKKW